MSRPPPRKMRRNTASVPVAPCIECGGLARPVKGNVTHPGVKHLAEQTFYLCICGAFVGSHPNTNLPVGHAAGPTTRYWRNQAHLWFDLIWRERHMTREAAYNWLTRAMGMSRMKCHIGKMGSEDAIRVVNITKIKLLDLRREAKRTHQA